MMTAKESISGLTTFTVMVYWSCILLGLGIPWIATIAVDVSKHEQSLAEATHQWQLHLFAPGYNLFLSEFSMQYRSCCLRSLRCFTWVSLLWRTGRCAVGAAPACWSSQLEA